MQFDPESIMAGVNWTVQLIGLISAWKQERSSSDGDNFQDFIVWLENHNFQSLKERICQSEELARDLNDILREDMASISGKLDVIHEAVMAVSSHIRGFDRLFETAAPGDSELSDQACSILREFAESNQTDLIYYHLKSLGGQEQHRFVPSIRNITTPRFIKADLESLMKFRFLTLTGYTDRDGSPKYSLTRSGAKFANQLTATAVQNSGLKNPP